MSSFYLLDVYVPLNAQSLFSIFHNSAMAERQTLRPTTEEILEECPRFRILVVGRSGVGKSSLINHVFGVDLAIVSHHIRGECNIKQEITSEQNPRFVLHDSMGFEPGQTQTYDNAKAFLESRGEGAALNNRIHAIWLCIQVPHAGGRVFETGDEEFLNLAATLKVPIIVVFTQFDKLISAVEKNLTDKDLQKSESKIDALVNKRADDEFKKICLPPLRRINRRLSYARTSELGKWPAPSERATSTVVELVSTTQTLLEGTPWFLSAISQRASARTKIDVSIQVGMKKYWRGLASSTYFPGFKLETCLAAIHVDIIASWNFNDPDDLLNSEPFLTQMKEISQLVIPDEQEVKSWFKNAEKLQPLIGVGAAIATQFPAAAPVVIPVIAAIGLSALFLTWFASVYERTAEVLRFFMGYIVDLTLVMDHLFLALLPGQLPRRLTAEDINLALENYKKSEVAAVHTKIRKYEVKDLIKAHRAR
ncbi:hypothetical protein B0H14DRAFT_1634295 [Mycena olivaceomarginata]|nr:hypothetical protein B0H14DRAFT_1634295 [Mycena olivaceomarginata]